MTRRAVSLALAASARAQDVLQRKAPAADVRIPYGGDPNQFADLRVPSGTGPHPLAINIHGGFWKAAYNLEHNGHLCEALRKRGVATWSIEYRRIGQAGGGWPGTFDDVKAAAAYALNLPKNQPIDPSRVIAMGHSAGGHLALWLAAELPWLLGAISLAGVADLRKAYALKLSQGIVGTFLGGAPEEEPDRYRLASPIERLPIGKPMTLIHGEKDTIVPIEIARGFEARARKAGDAVKLHALAGAGHFELIDPATPQWATVERSVFEMLRMA
jgi:acetyl esterase/lipase